jgi:hypothetical protein
MWYIHNRRCVLLNALTKIPDAVNIAGFFIAPILAQLFLSRNRVT